MGLRIIRRGEIHDMEAWERFSCDVTHDNPRTPDRRLPDVRLVREFDNHHVEPLRLRMPDREEIEVWVLRDPNLPAQFPSHTMRVKEGQIVHTTLRARTNTHTIHHHGIEPTTMNDGVGHLSFEVTSEYTYQWQASHAGTYFYHCHKNTVLHFEMGMYGFLIVDPPEGEGFIRRMDATIRYDVEALWAMDEFDPRWHRLNHDAGLGCPFGDNEGLNRFDPKYFLITGVPSPATETDPRVAIRASAGQTIVLRLLNSGYTLQRVALHGLAAEVIEIDSRTLGHSDRSPYSQPIAVPPGTPIELTTAQRNTLLVRPDRAGTYPITVEYRDWITGALYHTAQSRIEVT